MHPVDAPMTQDADRRYVTHAMKRPMLEALHESDLARRWRTQGDIAALHELTGAYLRLVIATARRYRHYGLPPADLVQEGTIGLMQAAGRFDPDRQVRFSTYAAWWIRAAIQDFVLRNWSIVRTGSTASQKLLFFNLRRLRSRLAHDGQGSLGDEACAHIAASLGVSAESVSAMATRLSGGDRSLNRPLGVEGEADWQDLLADERPLPDAVAAERHDAPLRRAWLRRGLATLDARQLRILLARNAADPPMTLEDLGRRLGISKERVRQIEVAAMARLRKALTAEVPDPLRAGLLPD